MLHLHLFLYELFPQTLLFLVQSEENLEISIDLSFLLSMD